VFLFLVFILYLLNMFFFKSIYFGTILLNYEDIIARLGYNSFLTAHNQIRETLYITSIIPI
jgi:hypothetical protein